jgi:hypothetical protein
MWFAEMSAHPEESLRDKEKTKKKKKKKQHAHPN